MPKMQHVASSAIEMVGYDDTSSALHVVYTGGARYVYRGVPSHVYHQLLAAKSKGNFINTSVKPIYPATPLQF